MKKGTKPKIQRFINTWAGLLGRCTEMVRGRQCRWARGHDGGHSPRPLSQFDAGDEDVPDYCAKTEGKPMTERADAVVTELLESSREILALLDSGTLVRDTSHDHESGWAMKQIPLVRALARFNEAIRAAGEAREGSE